MSKIVFSEEQINGMTAEEKELLNNLAERHHIELPDSFKEEQERIMAHVKQHFAREKENDNYTKQLESQFV